MAKATTINFHEDPTFFREAINFTAAETAFSPRLIEQDYFCTVLLAQLANAADAGLVFKGGTCLAKVHYGFHRLSEDLDFGISTPIDAKRKDRQRASAAAKAALTSAIKQPGCFRTVEPLRGANNSTQYLGVIGYQSQLGDSAETIKIEVSLREPMVLPVANEPAHTVLLNPLTRKPLLAPINVWCINKTEALAEKFRAAMSRRGVAIRDYFDIAHAEPLHGDVARSDFLQLVKAKLAIPGNDPVDLGRARMDALRDQVEAILKPVLRSRDFDAFKLDNAINAVRAVAAKLVAPV